MVEGQKRLQWVEDLDGFRRRKRRLECVHHGSRPERGCECLDIGRLARHVGRNPVLALSRTPRGASRRRCRLGFPVPSCAVMQRPLAGL